MVHMSENEQEQVVIEIAVDCQQQQSISKSGPKDNKFRGNPARRTKYDEPRLGSARI